MPAAGYELRTIARRRARPPQPAEGAARRCCAPRARSSAARALLRELRADAVLGGGGYVAGPVGLAAVLLRVPLVLTEADSHLGLDQPAARAASRGGSAWRSRSRAATAARYLVTGRPVPPPAARSRRRAGALRARRGGHRACSCSAARWARARSTTRRSRRSRARAFRVLHAAGAARLRRRSQRAPGPHYDLREYISTTSARRWPPRDLVVARAGGSVFEIAAAGRPAILVPYPHADRRPPDAPTPAGWCEARRRGRDPRRRADGRAARARGRRAARTTARGSPRWRTPPPRSPAPTPRGRSPPSCSRQCVADRAVVVCGPCDRTPTHRDAVPAWPLASLPAVTDERAWAGRRLHFVGIGGAGMSGLALVAHALGAEVSGSDRAESAYAGAAARRRGSTRASATTRRTCRGGRRGRLLDRGARRTTPSAPRRARAGCSSCTAPTCSARSPRCGAASRSPARTARRRRRAWSSTRCAAAGMDPGYLVGGEVRSTGSQRRLGRGGVARRRGRRVGSLAAEAPPRVAVLTNVELDHHATYASQRELRRDLPRVPRARDGGRRRCGTGRSCARSRRVAAPRSSPTTCPRPRPRRRRAARASTGAALEVAPRSVPGAHNALNAAGGARSVPPGGRGPSAGGRRARRLPRRRAPLRAARHDRRRRARSTTTTPTTRPRSPRRSQPRARSGRGAWSPSSSRTSTRARARCAREFGARARRRRRRDRARRLPGARAAGGLPRRRAAG